MGDPIAKLIDFGCVSSLPPVVDCYAPHEALMQKPTATKESDLFRLGCCLYVMLMAAYPFDPEKNDIENRKAGRVFKPPRWQTLSKEAQDLITALCRDRISAGNALGHP